MDRIKKPTVFISYSHSDKAFIDKLTGTLASCQINCWRDIENIRDGESWMESIFQDGIPGCDCLFLYLTDKSIESPVVKKEIDSAFIKKLKDSDSKILPYVDSASVRSKLRLDLQSLHCREFNDDNYCDVCPSVVAEIWRAFHEKEIKTAIRSEMAKRTELEKKVVSLGKNSESKLFSEREDQEFALAYKDLNIKMTRRTENSLFDGRGTYDVSINLLGFLKSYSSKQALYVDYEINKSILDKVQIASVTFTTLFSGNIRAILNKYSFLINYDLKSGDEAQHYEELSNRFYRFMLWLEVNSKEIPNADVIKEKVL